MLKALVLTSALALTGCSLLPKKPPDPCSMEGLAATRMALAATAALECVDFKDSLCMALAQEAYDRHTAYCRVKEIANESGAD